LVILPEIVLQMFRLIETVPKFSEKSIKKQN